MLKSGFSKLSSFCYFIKDIKCEFGEEVTHLKSQQSKGLVGHPETQQDQDFKNKR